MSNLKEEWEKKQRKIWERELRGYDEDACEQMPAEEEPEESV
jgi:hypothetical protein